MATALGEEIGWRGSLGPHLDRRFGFTGGVLFTGAIWALWHARHESAHLSSTSQVAHVHSTMPVISQESRSAPPHVSVAVARTPRIGSRALVALSIAPWLESVRQQIGRVQR